MIRRLAASVADMTWHLDRLTGWRSRRLPRLTGALWAFSIGPENWYAAGRRDALAEVGR